MLTLTAGRDARSSAAARVYARHRPDRTLLYKDVQQFYPAFKAYRTTQGAELPRYVEHEFEYYLECGRLEQGFLGVRYDSCHATT